jgi:hypothetical protein
MPSLELPPEVLEEIRQTEPLACPLCRDEREEPNYNLGILDRGASEAQTGVVIRCSTGHVFLDAFVPLDGRVDLGTVVVDSPAGPGMRGLSALAPSPPAPRPDGRGFLMSRRVT